jgi:TRAP-type mannitol/chloroaromatic compound transport system permease small subunit
MGQKLSLVVRKMDYLSIWSGRILAGLILIMAGIILYEVVARYLFNSPTIWGLELATMIFGTYILGAGAWTWYRGAHVRMDLFYDRWSKRTKAVIDVFSFPLVLLFLGVIFWKSSVYGIEAIRLMEHSHTVWGPPVYHWKMTLPVAILLMMLQGLADFLRNVTLAITGKEL